MKKQRDFTVFDKIEIDTPGTNQFDCSFGNNLTLDMGKLYPVMVEETLPNSYYRITPSMLLRFMPMINPVYQKMDATIHFFYCPKRVIWENYPRFIAGEDFAVPYFQQTTSDNQWSIQNGSLCDYMGLPESTSFTEKIEAIPFLTYLKIYNEYFQDQNNDPDWKPIRDALIGWERTNGLMTAGSLKPGAEDYANALLLKTRAWEHDIWTSALPYAQKGSPVNIPVSLVDLPVRVLTAVDTLTLDPVTSTDLSAVSGALFETPAGGPLTLMEYQGVALGQDAELQGTIADLRNAEALQKFLETIARSGTRYNEFIRAIFGQGVGDARINRPEYLGKVMAPVQVSEVLQTVSTGDAPLGDMGGHGAAVASGRTISFKCPEHGYIMAILSVLPTTSYFQGVPKKYQRLAQLDNYFPQFAHVGEMAIKNKEVCWIDAASDNDDDFGYISRDAHYKYNPSETHGDFRGNLLSWSLARKFDSRPVLNGEFVYCNPGKRIFAVTEEGDNSLLARIWFDVKASKPIPFFSTPGLKV
ncbi:MAG: major capsid protein [Microvirus sp.]|nr:MAG: major capsid protein [Microvirus sp.]